MLRSLIINPDRHWKFLQEKDYLFDGCEQFYSCIKQRSGVGILYWKNFFDRTETSTCTCVCNTRYLQYTSRQLILLFVLTHLFVASEGDVNSSGYRRLAVRRQKNNEADETKKEAIVAQFEI